jgi:hypothetical protein
VGICSRICSASLAAAHDRWRNTQPPDLTLDAGIGIRACIGGAADRPRRPTGELGMDARIGAHHRLEGWRSRMVLKRDVFSTVERGHFRHGGGDEVDAVMRRIDEVPWWSWPIARHFLHREARALEVAGRLGIGPPLLFSNRELLIRGFLDGVALKIAKPTGDRAYFRSAKSALLKLHRAGVCHNDLAKEQNWLKGADGLAYLIDFQLATRFVRRGKLFRIAAYEDLRHLLKHKRKYLPDALTPSERRMVSRKSLPTRIWMATGKRLYLLVTRGLLGFKDQEGGGPRLAFDAPRIEAALKAYHGVRDAAVVAFPDRSGRVGLYAFVEAEAALELEAANAAVAVVVGRERTPEFMQRVDALPRDAEGRVRSEILHLVATDQIDLIPPLIASDAERGIIDEIAAGRRNLYDVPEVEALLRTQAGVHDAAVVPVADRITGAELYAFVEGDVAAEGVRSSMVAVLGRKAPRYVQAVDALPRDQAGRVRYDILRLAATNQVDLIEPLLRSAAERALVERIVANRQNLHDRFVL